MTVESVSQEALRLPVSGRALLVERLLASLAGEVDADVERETLEEIRKRREAFKTGKIKLVDGEEAMRQARAALRNEASLR